MSTQPMGPVVVGVDGSDASLVAVDLAAEEAAARVTPLTVVHACSTYASDAASREGHARRLLAAAVDRARVEHPSLALTAVLVAGEPADALAGSTVGASLLVLGHHGRRSGPRRTDSVTAQLLGRVDIPVLIHRPFDAAAPAGTRPVVVGLADPTTVDILLEFAFEAAAARGAPLCAMHVRPPAIGDDTHAADALAAAVDLWADKYPGVAVRRLLRHGVDVAVAITAVSHAAQLVVVGVQAARTGTSVANALLHRAGCPVAAVPLR